MENGDILPMKFNLTLDIKMMIVMLHITVENQCIISQQVGRKYNMDLMVILFK